MVPLYKRNPLLKLPGAGLLAERPRGLHAHQKLIAVGLGISIISAGFLGSDAWFLSSMQFSIHELAHVQGPHIASLLESQRALAELVNVEAERRLGGESPGPGLDPVDRLDQSEIALASALTVAAKDEVDSDEEQALASNVKNVFELQSQLGGLPTGNKETAGRFVEIMESRVNPFIDSTGLLIDQHTNQFYEAENEPPVGLSYLVFVLTICATGVGLSAASFYLLTTTKRLVNPGLLGGLILVINGGLFMQGHMAVARLQLDRLQNTLTTFNQLEKVRQDAAQLSMYLHTWALTDQQTYWSKAAVLNSQLGKLSQGSYSSFSSLEHGEPWGALDSPSDSVQIALRSISKQWEGPLSNERPQNPEISLALLRGTTPDSQFKALDSALFEDQQRAHKQVEDAVISNEAALQNVLWVGIATCIGTIGLAWAGLVPRIKEYL